MSFSIEVPAETNPMNQQAVHQCLRGASSHDLHQIQSGTKQLENWATTPGFYVILQDIFRDEGAPAEIRYLAIIQIKNALDKYWRNTATSAISKEEKRQIRSRCLKCCLEQPQPWLALQASIVMARIVRYDYPHHWPDAIESVKSNLRYGDQGIPSYRLARALTVLLFITKELPTARLPRSRIALHDATPDLLRDLFAVYGQSVQRWTTFLKQGGEDEGGAMESLEHSLLAMRVIRRLVVLLDFPNRQETVRQIWCAVTEHLNMTISLASQTGTSKLTAGPLSTIQRLTLQYVKMHLGVARTHQIGFVLLPKTPDLCRSYWQLICSYSEGYGIKSNQLDYAVGRDGDAGEEMTFQERIILHSLLILRACAKLAFYPVQTFRFSHPVDKEETKAARDCMQQSVFTEHFCMGVMEVLVTKYFVFTTRDLRQWENEPDEWEKTQEGAGDDWEFSIRTCAEKLFLEVLIKNKATLAPRLVEILQQRGFAESDDILTKDSTFAAIGLAAPVLEQTFDFQTFLKSTLVPQVQVSGPGSNIIRRRVAIVLSQWSTVKMGLDRPLIYTIFQHLLNPEDPPNDEVVQITAGRQLHAIIEPFDFTADAFAPFLSVIIERLSTLIQKVELVETKLALLDTISTIVVKMELELVPFANEIIDLLSSVWSQLAHEPIVQQSILGILTRLVTSLGGESSRYTTILVSIIQSSVAIGSPDRQYLLEDAMELWSALVEQSPSPPPTQELVGLIEHLFPTFESDNDTVCKGLEITLAYLHLIPGEMLSNVNALLRPLSSLFKDLTRKVNGSLTEIIQVMIQSAAVLGQTAAVESVASDLVSSGLLPQLLCRLRGAHKAHETTGPNREPAEIDSVVEADYLSILARLSISSPRILVAVTPISLEWLVKEWFLHMDSISNPIQKKLNCFGITALLDLGEPWLLTHLQSYMTLWTDVIVDLVEESEDEQGNFRKVDCLVHKSNAEDRLTNHERELKLMMADPVSRIDVQDFIRGKLETAITRCGGLDVFRNEWLSNVDKDVVREFEVLAII